MIELPEAYVLADQIGKTLTGKTIANVAVNTHPHKFAFYNIDPSEYHEKLTGKRITSANPGTGHTCGGNVEILCEDYLMVVSTPVKYHAPGEKLPAKHQLLLEFEDFSHMSCTVQMWGSMMCIPIDGGDLPESYHINKSPSPLSDAFNESYFENLYNNTPKKLSVKAFLATEQRIPGLGNGICQDILFNAKLNPRTRLDAISDEQLGGLFRALKQTITDMAMKGGRDTELDLFGCSGGYKTILSQKTIDKPCNVCGSEIIREAFLGGNIYYCPVCQPKA